MYARVGTGPVRPDRIDEAIRILRESVYPVSKGQPGFRGAYFLVDRTAGNLLASETSGYLREQAGKIAPLLGTPHIVEHWEVAAEA